MKKKKRLRQALALLLVFCSLLLCAPANETIMAASSYNNAMEFYNSTGQTNGKHIDITNGIVYFATQAKIASSSSNLRYTTLGFDVTLTGNRKSVSFAVKRGGSLAEVPWSRRDDGKYEYILYQISTEDLYRLAQATGNANAKTVLNASTIEVRMNAIMTTKKNGVEKGSISENGYGGLHETAPVYHLNNSSHLSEMKDIFLGHEFKSYINIDARLANYSLSIIYDAGNGSSVGNGHYKGTFNAGSLTAYNAIHTSGAVVMDNHKVVNEFYLKSPSYFGLSKTGYHLDAGKEWKKADGSVYTSNWPLMPKQLDPEVGYRSKGVILYANWQPNAYTINYNGNGADGGTISPQSMVYDKSATLRNNLFYRTGYTFNGWNTKADGTGAAYSDQQTVSNLATSGTITLYAQWKPCVYKITTDKQSGTDGTDIFYEKFNTGFYSNSACTSNISSITIPSRIGYDFMGYYSWINKSGQMYVNNVGKIVAPSTQFTENTTAYAGWEAKKFPITFDKQEGIFGSDMVIATYDSEYPQADAPVREGYSFKGYFTETDGNGTQYYNEFMSSGQIFKYVNALTLYAYWIDDVPPEVNLETTHEKWTNDTIGLTASATDFGSGLDSICVYIIEADGSLTCVAEETNLNGVKVKELTFSNNTEGVIRYKAVATDVVGNVAESYNTVYYDTEAPNGDVTATINGTTFYFEVDITDINTGD